MPDTNHAVIVGGGLGGLEAALYLKRRLGDAAEVTLVSEQSAFIFKPYLTYVPFGLDPQRARLALADLARTQGFHLRQGIAHGVAPDRRALRVSGEDLPYDVLFLATGAAADPEALPGLHDYALVLGREGDMQRLRRALHRLRETASAKEASAKMASARDKRRIVFLAPPGCGWAGALYELAFMTATWLEWKNARAGTEIMLLTAEHRFMDVFGADVHAIIQQDLRSRGIEARRHQHPKRVEDGALVFPEGGRLRYDLLVAAPAHRAALRWEALPTDARGFLRTETASRQVVGYPDIYALGDAADYPVKQGFLALLQADAAAEDWAARVRGEEPAFTFEPEGTWLMEQFDQALLAKGDLGPDVPPTQPARAEHVPVGQLRRVLTAEHVPRGAGATNPLYAGLLWKGTETSLKLLKHLHTYGAT